MKKVYGYLKQAKIQYPLKKIAVAVSGGSDSVALALLLAKYGQSLYTDSLEFIHINHMWRQEESLKDQKFVEELGTKYNIKVNIFNCPNTDKKLSKELEARNHRKEIFKQFANNGYYIFTGHNSNDVLETLLWRLCDNKMSTHDKGILIKTDDNQFRPFLTTSKEELQAFLNAENQDWHEDYTNHDGKLMRSKLRKNVVPELMKIYPKALLSASIYAINQQKY